MPRSASSVPPSEHKAASAGGGVKHSQQESLDAMDTHTLALILLRQKAARAERSHVVKVEKYADKHAILMKQYADKILDIQRDLDALCLYHGETFVE